MRATKPSTRPLPTLTQLAWRRGFLSGLASTSPIEPTDDMPVGLSPGNKKTGTSGSLYKTVFVWNLPSVVLVLGVRAYLRQQEKTSED